MEENRKKVKEALENKKIDFAVNTNWPFIGPFLKFLSNTGVLNEFKTLKSEQKRNMLKTYIYVLIYIIKLIVGIPRIRGSEVLLGDLGAMKLLGFDVDTLKNGLCNRGDANQYGKGYKKKSNCHGRVYIN